MANQTDTIIATVLDWIDTGRLNPGDEVEESTLVTEFGVSRTPVREAMIRLEASGLVTRPPRKGIVVFKPTLEEFLAILEVHAKLEGQAAGLAARRLSASSAAALEQATRACEDFAAAHGSAGDETGAYYALNLKFHAVVAGAAGNPFLLDMIATNARKLMAYYRARYRYAGAIPDSAAEHRQIATLITARDADAAEALMRRHVQFDQVTAMDLLAALG